MPYQVRSRRGPIGSARADTLGYPPIVCVTACDDTVAGVAEFDGFGVELVHVRPRQANAHSQIMTPGPHQ